MGLSCCTFVKLVSYRHRLCTDTDFVAPLVWWCLIDTEFVSYRAAQALQDKPDGPSVGLLDASDALTLDMGLPAAEPSLQ